MTSQARAFRIAAESPHQPDVLKLLSDSDQYLSQLYPADSNHSIEPDALAERNTRLLVARERDRAMGCGAIIFGADGSAELKRIWVDPEARGSGLGRQLLVALEDVARRNNVTVIRLETGTKQAEALALYRASGYVECSPYGAYNRDPLSVFMEKIAE